MTVTKMFCIVVGVVLMIGTVLPAPFGLVLESWASLAVSHQMSELLRDGSIVVVPEVLRAKHAEMSEFGDPNDAATLMVCWAASRSVSGPGLAVSGGMLLMGIAWVVVGIRIPTRVTGPAR